MTLFPGAHKTDVYDVESQYGHKMYPPSLKNTFLLETVNRHLNLQEVVIFLLGEGPASVLMAAAG